MKFLQKITRVLIGIVLLGFGASAFCFGVYQSFLAYRSESWTETNGRIVKTEIVCHSSKGGSVYSPHVVFSYEVGGVVYYSDNYSYGWGSQGEYGFIGGDQKTAEASLKRYEVGASVPVFYNPENPEQVCLKKGGISWANGLPIFLGAFFAGVIIFIWRLRLSHKPGYLKRRRW